MRYNLMSVKSSINYDDHKTCTLPQLGSHFLCAPFSLIPSHSHCEESYDTLQEGRRGLIGMFTALKARVGLLASLIIARLQVFRTADRPARQRTVITGLDYPIVARLPSSSQSGKGQWLVIPWTQIPAAADRHFSREVAGLGRLMKGRSAIRIISNRRSEINKAELVVTRGVLPQPAASLSCFQYFFAC
jgi:hypothetical protein